jgi:hypothetical protein
MEDNFHFNSKVISRHKTSNELLFFGYPLFGGWLPFIGFRIERVEETIYRAFLAEWFMYSVGYVTHIEEDNK